MDPEGCIRLDMVLYEMVQNRRNADRLIERFSILRSETVVPARFRKAIRVLQMALQLRKAAGSTQTRSIFEGVAAES
jgi:hypothetical protein